MAGSGCSSVAPALLLALPTLRLLPDGPAKVRWLSDEQRNWLQEQLASDLRGFGQTRHGNPLHALKMAGCCCWRCSTCQ